MADELKAPPRNALLGLLADALKSADEYTQRKNHMGGLLNPPVNVLAGLLGLPGAARTADRLSYGEPLTNMGKGSYKPLIPQDTVDAAGLLAMVSPAISRGAMRASDAAVRAITGNKQANSVNVLAQAAQMRPTNPITVWHGSPHKFDKFDSSKIGTGEGAQAYGHGLYLAESPDVARQYQEALSKQVSYGGRRVAETHPSDSPLEAGRHAVAARVANGEDAGAAMKAEADSWRQQANFYRLHANEVPEAAGEADSFDAVARAIESLNPAEFYKNPGSLYKVDLPDEAVARMLDWDKPLSQQHPDIRMIGRDAGIPETESGQALYQALVNQSRDGAIARGQNAATTLGASQSAASRDLRTFGIPGIRYLDGGSRGAGAGTSNFVVFPGEENILSILARNGQPLK